MGRYSSKSAYELSAALSAGSVSPTTLAEVSCVAAEASESMFISVDRAGALRQSEASAHRFQIGKQLGALDGIPVAVKDVIDTAGVRTTMASALFQEHFPRQNAAVVESLLTAGATIVGKTNCQEFSYGIRGDDGAFGRVSNPYDPRRIAGGSSSGSAAAVATGICPLAVGTDTGGSIRIPAAFCGVVGFKPTYGLIETRGVFPLAPSFDTVGYFATTVQDIVDVLSATGVVDRSELFDPQNSGKLRATALGDLRSEVASEEIGTPFDQAVEILDAEESELPGYAGEPVDFVDLYNQIRSYEAYAVHREFLATDPERYRPGTRQRLEADARVSKEVANKAFALRAQVQTEYLRAFADVDIIISPTVPIMAPLAEEQGPLISGQLMSHVIPWNVLGWPALTVPFPMADVPHPQAVQIIGKPGDDLKVLGAGRMLEVAFLSTLAR